MAHELGRNLHEVMGWPGPMTHRQYVAWQAWLRSEWDRPSRSDWYVMQLTAIVAGLFDKKSSTEKFKLPPFKWVSVPNAPNIRQHDIDSPKSAVSAEAEKITGIRRMTKEDIAKAQRNIMLVNAQARREGKVRERD